MRTTSPAGESGLLAGRRVGPPSLIPQTVLVRRLIAGALALLVLVLLAVAVNSCLNSRQENALKDYTREVSSIATESERQVGAGVLQHAAPARQRVPAGPPDRHLGLPRPGRDPAQPGRGPRRPGRDGARAALPADRAAVPPRRPRLHRRAHPARAGRPGRPGRGGGQPDRRPDGGLPRLRRRLLRTGRAARPRRPGRRGGRRPADRPLPVPAGHPVDRAGERRRGARPAGLRRRHAGPRTSASPPRACTATAWSRLPSATRRSSRAPPPTASPPARTRPSRCASPTRARTTSSTSRSTSRSSRRTDSRSGSRARSTPSSAGAEATAEIPLGTRPPLGAATVRVLVNKVPGEEKTDNNRGEYDVGFVAP